MKRIVIFVFLFLCANMASADNYKAEWPRPDISLKPYQEMAVSIIDLRGIEIQTQNVDTLDYEKDTLKPEVFELVAQAVNHHMSGKVKLAMAVVEDEKKLKDLKTSLLLNIKLKGSFKARPQRALMQLLASASKRTSEVSKLNMEAEVIDARTKQTIVSLSDIQPISLKLYGDPFNNDQDLTSLGLILDVWGDKIAGLIASKR
ncbi:MAG: hypothetical protein HQL26_03115 [Candidatus Omnitrophica bacterium]|nr:hypothetical protein [Candidatus Omnitrophota bacterium]